MTFLSISVKFQFDVVKSLSRRNIFENEKKTIRKMTSSADLPNSNSAHINHCKILINIKLLVMIFSEDISATMKLVSFQRRKLGMPYWITSRAFHPRCYKTPFIYHWNKSFCYVYVAKSRTQSVYLMKVMGPGPNLLDPIVQWSHRQSLFKVTKINVDRYSVCRSLTELNSQFTVHEDGRA